MVNSFFLMISYYQFNILVKNKSLDSHSDKKENIIQDVPKGL